MGKSIGIGYQLKDRLLTTAQQEEITTGVNRRQLAEKFNVPENVIVSHAREKGVILAQDHRDTVLDWSKVDWSKNNKRIAYEYGVIRSWVKEMRRNYVDQ